MCPKLIFPISGMMSCSKFKSFQHPVFATFILILNYIQNLSGSESFKIPDQIRHSLRRSVDFFNTKTCLLKALLPIFRK